MSQRSEILQKICAILREERSGAYYVRRGAINWASWDFDAHPQSVAVMQDEANIFKRQGFYSIDVGIEFACRMRQDCLDIDDTRNDEFFEDTERAVRLLRSATKTDGSPLVAAIQGGNATEFYDAAMGVQGLVVELTISY